MSDWKKLPFGIDFVVQQDLIPLGIKTINTSNGYSFNCPFCAKNGLTPDRKHKYSVNIYKNVGHCFRCQSGHGILSLHQALSTKSITLEESKKDLMDRWNGLPSDVKVELSQVQVKLEEENKKQLYPAPIEIRDLVYRRFLNQLTLSSKHHDDLIKRGLTEEDIVRGNYKSVPALGFCTFAENSFDYDTYKALKNHPKWGIPGFYEIRTNHPKVVALDSGYFVPVLDEYKRISGMQIRYDALPEDAPEEKREHYAKYKWFTSNMKNKVDGCTASGCENVHYAGDFVYPPKTVILTEGVLKADVASSLSKRICGNKNQPILGLVGVYNTENLAFELLKLKDRGLKKVVVAVDMDYLEKPQVKLAMDNIKEIIHRVDIDIQDFHWKNGNKLKGIDDYFLEVYNTRENKLSIKSL